jgi:hypothetical protein
MGAVDYLTQSGTDLKTLLENDSELSGYAATPYSETDELVRIQKKYPEISLELHTIKNGEFTTGNPEKIIEYRIRSYTEYTDESTSKTQNNNIAGRIIEILDNPANWTFTNGSYRIDTDVNFEYETAISNKGKISRSSEIIAGIYLRE